MLVYIIKSVACLAILFVFYKLFLEKESVHQFKRFYLLIALIFSLLVPTLVFTEYVEVSPIEEMTNAVTQPTQVSEDVINIPAALEADILDIEPLLWGVYFLGLFFFGLKFIRNLFQIFKRIRKNPKHKLARFTQVLLQEKITPHTFFSYIFLNKSKFEANQIPKEVLLHEETHAKQKHSLDVIFIELLQVILWFNPFIYLAKKAIKLNHEFLADQAVLKNNIDKSTYQNTLLSYLSPDSEKKYQPLANAINYSSIKKRFTIMKTQTSKKAILFRSLLLLPLLALLLYGFSETKVETIIGNSSSDQLTHQEEIVEEKLEPESKQNTDGASEKQLSEYNALAKKYNQQKEGERTIRFIDVEKLYAIYKVMTTSQKEAAEPFPNIPPPPPPMDSMEEIKNLNNYKSPNGETIEIVKNATTKETKEFNVLAKKYNAMLSKSMSIQIKIKDVERLEYIYGLMSDQQKSDAEPFPSFPEPPKSPRVLKGEKSNIPPPPPSKVPKQDEIDFPPTPYGLNYIKIDENATQEVIAHREIYAELKRIELYKNNSSYTLPADYPDFREIDQQPTRPRILKGQISDIPLPPNPPTPKSPLDHVIEMAKKNAKFYLEGKEITSDKAIEIMKKNKNINIDSRGSTGKQPLVKMSTKPIRFN